MIRLKLIIEAFVERSCCLMFKNIIFQEDETMIAMGGWLHPVSVDDVGIGIMNEYSTPE